MRVRSLLSVLVLAWDSAPVSASRPVWTVATAADFFRGTSDGVFVSAAASGSPGRR